MGTGEGAHSIIVQIDVAEERDFKRYGDFLTWMSSTVVSTRRQEMKYVVSCHLFN